MSIWNSALQALRKKFYLHHSSMVMFILNIENVIIKKDLTKFIYENNYKRIGRIRTESDYSLKNKKRFNKIYK